MKRRRETMEEKSVGMRIKRCEAIKKNVVVK